MPIPIVCLDARLRQFVLAFRSCFNQPQMQYFVTVLLGLMLCQERRTLSGLQRQVAEHRSLSGLSRFLAEAPWSAETVAQTWLARFRDQLSPMVEADQRHQRQTRPTRPGRPPSPIVTGYLVGDDSTQPKDKAQTMGGLGWHHSTTVGRRVVGHSLVQGLYVLLGRRCPVAPQLYRQRGTCQAEDVPFHSKIDLMEDLIRTFEPVAGTRTHVLVDTWYAAKRIWRAARARGFLITSGLKSNRALRVDDPTSQSGWRWQTLSQYAATLSEADYTPQTWPSQTEPHPVYVHIVQTRVRRLYRCQVLIVRQSLTAPLSEARFFASSDVKATPSQLLVHLATRWEVEILFADAKEELGLDHYQVMSATAIVRFWTLVMAAYLFLDEERARLRETQQDHVTIGQARREVQRRHRRHLIDWLVDHVEAGCSRHALYDRLAA